MADLAAGRPMRCAGDRCSFCFIHPLCQAMREAVAALRRGAPGVLRVDLPGGDDPERHRALLEQPRDALWVRAADAAAAAAVPGTARARALWLQLDDLRGLRKTLRAAGIQAPLRLIPGAKQLRQAARLSVAELAVTLERETLPRLATLAHRPGTRLLLQALPAATLREEAERGAEPTAAWAELPADGWLDVPPCLSGAGDVTYEDALPLTVLDAAGRVDPDAFVDHFVRTRYRVKSLRCEACRHHGACRGISVHRARLSGLALLQPIPPAAGG